MVSTLNGPIPPHPYYDKSPNYGTRQVPRVRPEAEDIALQAQGSVGNLLRLDGIRIGSAPSMRKYKPEPRDHIKENVRRMRQIQRDTRRKQDEGHKPVKAMWKSGKFDNVQSKVMEELQKDPPAPRPHSAHYLRAHSRTGFSPGPRSRPSSAEPRPEKLTVPKAESARDIQMKHRDVDFIKVNGRAASRTGMRRSPSLTALDDLKKKKEEDEKNYTKGEVPKYLVNRQKQWQKEEERRIAMTPDPDLPQGHRMMEEKRKKYRLEKLQKTQRELLQQISSMPIRTDTLRIRTRKEELDNKLAEVEEAIRIFSRPKVFVRLDT